LSHDLLRPASDEDLRGSVVQTVLALELIRDRPGELGKSEVVSICKLCRLFQGQWCFATTGTMAPAVNCNVRAFRLHLVRFRGELQSERRRHVTNRADMWYYDGLLPSS
jgi:hypothetical protein